MPNIAVFCGSRSGARPEYETAARELGSALAINHFGLVYGGSHAGLMRVVSQSARENGGDVIGVMPRGLNETPDQDVADLRWVNSLSERKAMMADLSAAFVALPGGLGTLDEWSEIITWALCGLHYKPIFLLNIAGFYDSLLSFFDVAQSEGFLKAEQRALILVEKDVVGLMERLKDV
jgi:uncharacterized protein (TIGR00730 family)